ncbi:hypothetical protein SAMN05920897_10292 [Alkalispirochaeta americana]|uniref:Uncharacterized protein n=1 Tax=Alkalispirochaeta americana TaxID=159291 RepID=A0A1N6P286_9SPIO|nr:hypothetical protein [Alkalispirochaeta americana]SIP98455.1 hypothetical protein SAMN05920897_10292 [Alkalispirochaeta americana]
MSFRDHRVRLFEKKLKIMFDRIDLELEEGWGETYPLHPARPASGTFGNPQDEGLFSLGASFSAGYGSDHGRGYVVEVRLATLAQVPDNQVEQIREYVVTRIRELLPELFGDRSLEVVRDGDLFKIVGDLSIS